ncbi:MgtC/SapB family protein [Deminuibacter soli]|uniref:MgtC/SapB family protein n=1 Tax=Deminuibacter soli TaxID=2291815 RepID=A0A3E1NFP3_9BACT|nr:MgtC/SapB family protein [Deminuibacter soli]RFM26796.1 MgtC/SapB family protein [Deminuibacter soli]
MHFAIPLYLQQLMVALLIGAIIGAEREYRSKSAGLRTTILVSVGACLFTQLSVLIGGSSNPDRIAANIITGIGFLGAGVIFKEESKVTGITTATTIWMVAALGMAAGAGYTTGAFVAGTMVLLILVGLIYVQDWIETLNQLRSYKIVCPFRQETLERYEVLFKQYNLKAKRGRQSRIGDEITGNWLLQGTKKSHEALVQCLLQDTEIKEFDF